MLDEEKDVCYTQIRPNIEQFKDDLGFREIEPRQCDPDEAKADHHQQRYAGADKAQYPTSPSVNKQKNQKQNYNSTQAPTGKQTAPPGSRFGKLNEAGDSYLHPKIINSGSNATKGASEQEMPYLVFSQRVNRMYESTD